MTAADSKRQFADRVPPKRSSQIQDGFGINSDLPRDPYLPGNRWWWTRMFDAGFKSIRIGQYENSSDRTSWDWIEQKRSVYAGSQELEDYLDSLVDNGMKIQVQLAGTLMGSWWSAGLKNDLATGHLGKEPPDWQPPSGSTVIPPSKEPTCRLPRTSV